MGCLQRDLVTCLTFYTFPVNHGKTIGATNVIERLFHEVKRRSHQMAAAFHDEGRCLLTFFGSIRSLAFHKITMPAAK